jgi:hypothetical protein
MKYFLIAALFASPAYAENTAAELCPMFGKLAEQALEMRELGIPLSEIMEAAAGQKIVMAIYIDAYDLPMLSVPENIEAQKVEYRNSVEVLCWKELTP